MQSIVPVEARELTHSLFVVSCWRTKEFDVFLWDAYIGAESWRTALPRSSAASNMASPVAADFLPRSRAGSIVDDDLETDQAQVLRELQFLHT